MSGEASPPQALIERNEARTLRKENGDLKSRLGEFEVEKNELASQLEVFQDQGLSVQLALNEGERNTTQQVESLKLELAEAVEDLDSALEMNKELEDKLESLGNALNRSRSRQEEEIEGLKIRLEDYYEENSKSAQRNRELEAQVQELMEEIAELKATKRKQPEQHSEVTAHHQSIEAQIQQLKRENADLKAGRAKQRHSRSPVEGLEAQVQKLKSRLETSDTQLARYVRFSQEVQECERRWIGTLTVHADYLDAVAMRLNKDTPQIITGIHAFAPHMRQTKEQKDWMESLRHFSQYCTSVGLRTSSLSSQKRDIVDEMTTFTDGPESVQVPQWVTQVQTPPPREEAPAASPTLDLPTTTELQKKRPFNGREALPMLGSKRSTSSYSDDDAPKKKIRVSAKLTASPTDNQSVSEKDATLPKEVPTPVKTLEKPLASPESSRDEAEASEESEDGDKSEESEESEDGQESVRQILQHYVETHGIIRDETRIREKWRKRLADMQHQTEPPKSRYAARQLERMKANKSIVEPVQGRSPGC